MSFKTKVKLFLGTIFVLSFAFAVQSFAMQLSGYASLYKSKTPALENWTRSSGEANAVMGVDLIGNIETMQPELLKGQVYTQDGKRIVWIPGGALGSANQMIAALNQTPASGVQYIAQIKDSFLGKPAYAQSGAAQGLQPILPIWRAFRNFVYIISSLFFITIGIMIILRVKISPQAVITIQNALPQLIITLVLVTFSYAIAGLILDLSTLFQGLIISTLFSGLGKSTADSLLIPNVLQIGASSKLLGGNVAYSLSDLIAHNGFLQTFDLISRLIPAVGIISLCGIITTLIATIAMGGFLPGGAVVGASLSILLLLIVMIIILVKMIGFLFSLIKAYITIILKIILAPIEIGLGAYPGSKAGFSTWLTDLVANIAIFPVCLLFLVLTNVILEQIQIGGLWSPPLMGAASGLMTGQVIAAMFGFGAFLLLTKLPDLVPQVIFALKPSPYGQAIGQSYNESLAPAKFLYNTGVDVTAGGIAGGNRPFAHAYGVAESLFGNPSSPGSGAKTVADIIKNTLRVK